jgi:hypothetical protein
VDEKIDAQCNPQESIGKDDILASEANFFVIGILHHLSFVIRHSSFVGYILFTGLSGRSSPSSTPNGLVSSGLVLREVEVVEIVEGLKERGFPTAFLLDWIADPSKSTRASG